MVGHARRRARAVRRVGRRRRPGRAAAPHVRLVVERAGLDDLVVDGAGYDAAAADVTRLAHRRRRHRHPRPGRHRRRRDRGQGPRAPLRAAGGTGRAGRDPRPRPRLRLSRPFRDLAESAAALGRGRFDIEAPRSRIPEVVSISDSLRASSLRLQKSLRRDRDFFHHASHVLRTPLTGMRLELEELTLRGDLDADVRRTTARCLSDVERLDCTIAELLELRPRSRPRRGRRGQPARAGLAHRPAVARSAAGVPRGQGVRRQRARAAADPRSRRAAPRQRAARRARVGQRPGDDPLRRPGRARPGHRELRLDRPVRRRVGHPCPRRRGADQRRRGADAHRGARRALHRRRHRGPARDPAAAPLGPRC